jgi:TolB-like protein
MLWCGLWSGRAFLPSPLADDQSIKSAKAGAKPAIDLNLINDSVREYFTDGLTQDIINELGRFSSLTVMSWNAVFPYKCNPQSPGEIARRLAVRYQVEGSVSQIGDRARVTTQLVNSDGQVLWSARFDEAFTDLFALQNKITTQVAGAPTILVTEIEQRRVFAKPTAAWKPTTTCCAPGRPCSAPHAQTMWRRVRSSSAQLSSIRTTRPPMRRSPRPITWLYRWAGCNRRQSSFAARRLWQPRP